MRLAKIIFFARLICLPPTLASSGIKQSATLRENFELNQQMEKPIKILVLGAGWAGVSAAYTLLNDPGIKQEDIIVLEGRNEIGGRLRNARLRDGTVLELGANWIHGKVSQHCGTNPLWPLAQKIKLQGRDSDYDDMTAFDIKQGRLPMNQTRWGEFRTVMKCVESVRANLRKKVRNGERGIDISTRSAMQKCGWYPRTPMDAAVEWNRFDYDYGTSPFGSGTAGKSKSCSGENPHSGSKDFMITDSRGYKALVEEMAKPFYPRIKRNHIVKSINQTSTGYIVVTALDTAALREVTFKAKYVISTFSVGVLQRSVGRFNHLPDLVKFTPQLPSWKRDLISEKMSMALYTKLFLQFNSTFWDDTEFIMWASSHRGYYSGWQNMDKVMKGSRMLLVTLTGELALAAARSQDQDVISEAMIELRKFYKNAPEPIDYSLHHWGNDEFVLGSYSDLSTNVLEHHTRLLSYPVGNLYFSGEATHRDFYGTAHGALLSGAYAARLILQCIAGSCLPPYTPRSFLEWYYGWDEQSSYCHLKRSSSECRGVEGCAWSLGTCVPRLPSPV